MLEKKVKVTEKPNVFIYYIIGGFWLLAALVFPMIKLSSYLILFALTILGYYFLNKMLPKDQTVEEYVEKPNTGNMELDEVLTLGNQYVIDIHKANDAIKDPDLSNDIENIESLTKQILEAIEKRPSELSKIRKFMSYYLPTTIKLLNAYGEYEAQSFKTENIEKSMNSIKKSVNMIHGSFEKLLNSIYENDMLDITSDIAVYEKMASFDGYEGLKMKD